LGEGRVTETGKEDPFVHIVARIELHMWNISIHERKPENDVKASF
jgi:hypothetical protein